MLERDPEKSADFSDKIKRPDEEKRDPEKSADFSDKIMRPDEEKRDPEKLADFSDKIMRPNKGIERDRSDLSESRFVNMRLHDGKRLFWGEYLGCT